MTKTLNYGEARTFYDRFGEKQDKQGWYEDQALKVLREHGAFDEAGSVVEFGCGTGKLAAQLFEEELGPDAHYVGLDLSAKMIYLTTDRLKPFTPRADIRLVDGTPELPLSDQSADRFVSCYVIDLLSFDDARKLTAEARRVLKPGGLFCAAGLTRGTTFGSRFVSGLWASLHNLSPNLVGGCRPIEMTSVLPADDWTIRHREIVHPYNIPSEVIIAQTKEDPC